jgi:phage terminase large subunit-like protein
VEIKGVYFDALEVYDRFSLIESLTLTKSTRSGLPEPFVILPHARKFIGNLFGWKRPDGRRLYRTGFLTMARKNTKTQTCAALGITQLVLDDEQAPEIYCAAKSRDQASELFDAAAEMVNAHDELRDELTITGYLKEIRNPATGGVFKALSSEGKSKHGSNPSTIIFDEFHVWGERERELHKALSTGRGARRQPLKIYITTAGDDEQTMCYAEYTYAKDVLNGIIQDQTYFPLVYEVPKDADWTDRSLWPLANPTLGQVVQPDILEEDFQKALKRPHLQTEFRQLYLNQWVNAASTWIPLIQWDQCKWEPKTRLGNGS